MTNASRPVPRGAHIPFEIRIVGKKFALGRERGVIRIAISHAQYFEFCPVRPHPGNPTPRRKQALGVSASIPLTGKQKIFLPVTRQARGGEFGRLGVISPHHDQMLPIGSRKHCVRPMFSGPFERQDMFRRIEHPVAVCIADRPDTRPLTIHVGVEYAAVVAETLGVGNRDVDPLD